MHTRRMVATVFALRALFVSVWMLPDAAASEEPRERASPLAEMTLSASRIDWLPVGDSERLVLTVAGPEGLWLHKEFAAGQPVSLSLADPDWESPPDGTYTWELRAISPSGKQPQRPLVESGHFFVKDGSFVPARKKTSAKPTRPPQLITAQDLVEDGNLVVIGNACIGETCTINDDDYSALKLKAPQPNLLFDDDFVEGGNTPHDWALFINPSSVAEFSIADFENGLIPVTIAGGAPNSSLYVASNGKVGLGTATPGAPLHLFGSATSDAFIGMGPNPASGPAFNVGYGGSSFGRGAGYLNARGDASTTAPNPSLRFMTASVERMIVTNTGNVGIGTSLPSNSLHVKRTDGTAHLLIEEASGTAAWRTIATFRNSGGVQLNMHDTSAFGGTGFTWSLQNVNAQARISDMGDAVNEMVLDQAGNVTFAGTVTAASSRTIKERFSPVDSRDVLRRVLDLPITTWSYQETPGVRHVGPMSEDFFAAFAVGSDDKGISVTDSAGVALAAIQGLHRMVTEKEEEVAQLRRENADLARRLAALEALVLQGGKAEGSGQDIPPTP